METGSPGRRLLLTVQAKEMAPIRAEVMEM